MGRVAYGWSFILCCLHCLWAWHWCSASLCLLSDITRLYSLVLACTVPRCLSSGEGEKEKGLVARGPGTHGHSSDPAPPTMRMLQGTLSMPACWKSCWKRQDWRTPTCRIAPTDMAKVLASGNWTLESPSPACQCSQSGARRLLPDCPAMASAPPPPQALTSSGEIMQNLTGQNLSVFLVKTYPRLVHQGLKTKKWVNEVRPCQPCM